MATRALCDPLDSVTSAELVQADGQHIASARRMSMYTEIVTDHLTHQRNVGTMDDADGISEVGNPVYRRHDDLLYQSER